MGKAWLLTPAATLSRHLTDWHDWPTEASCPKQKIPFVGRLKQLPHCFMILVAIPWEVDCPDHFSSSRAEAARKHVTGTTKRAPCPLPWYGGSTCPQPDRTGSRKLTQHPFSVTHSLRLPWWLLHDAKTNCGFLTLFILSFAASQNSVVGFSSAAVSHIGPWSLLNLNPSTTCHCIAQKLYSISFHDTNSFSLWRSATPHIPAVFLCGRYAWSLVWSFGWNSCLIPPPHFSAQVWNVKLVFFKFNYRTLNVSHLITNLLRHTCCSKAKKKGVAKRSLKLEEITPHQRW